MSMEFWGVAEMSKKNCKECCWKFCLYFCLGVCVLVGGGGGWEAEKETQNLSFSKQYFFIYFWLCWVFAAVQAFLWLW